jgi:hypothetical protein
VIDHWLDPITLFSMMKATSQSVAESSLRATSKKPLQRTSWATLHFLPCRNAGARDSTVMLELKFVNAELAATYARCTTVEPIGFCEHCEFSDMRVTDDAGTGYSAGRVGSPG